MTKFILLILLASLSSASFSLMAADTLPSVPPAVKPAVVTLSDLRSTFSDPSMDQRLRAYWFWLGDAAITDGITKDLEAMQRVGIGGVLCFFMPGKWPVTPPPVTTKIFSDKWYEVVRHALSEAERLNIRCGMLMGPGWSGANGPWISPQESMRFVGIGLQPVTGPMKLSQALPKINDPDLSGYRTTWPIVVLAIPGKHTELGKDYNKNLATRAEQLIKALREPAVSPSQILNLDDKVTADGRIEWEVPAGDWTIVRIVSRILPGAEGNVNCFEPSITMRHLDTLFAPLNGMKGPRAKALRSIHHDSWELGNPTWSDSTRAAFEKGRGYDPRRWLPVLSGVTIGDRAQSERFIWDLRRTLSEQHLVHAATMRQWANAHGMECSQEGYGMFPNDLVQYQKEIEVPMNEGYNVVTYPGAKEGKDVYAATADFWGKTVVGYEFSTSDGQRSMRSCYPGMLKCLADYTLAMGYNRITLHCYPHQPYDKGPGLVLQNAYGTDYSRLQTWWEQSKPWVTHINRSQALLQQTQSAADILSVLDETTTGNVTVNLNKVRKILFREGWAEDMCDLDSLAVLKVKNGRIVGPVGQEYAVLLLNFSNPKMQPHCLREIKRLVEAGATILGDMKPIESPSLQDYPACDEEVKKLADALWDGGKVKPIKELDAVLKQLGLVQDFVAVPSKETPQLLWSHRRRGNADAYFVANPGVGKGSYGATTYDDIPWAGEVKFRITGKVPELWHPERGTMEPIAVWREEGQQTIIPLRFRSQESFFIVFRDKQTGDLAPLSAQPTDAWITTRGGKRYQQTETTTTLDVASPWQVKFQPPKGQGESWQQDFPLLVDWSKHTDARVQGFSGTATYKTTIQIKPEQVGGDLRYRLDLGRVEQIAEVRLNGKPLGIVYYKPYTLDAGDGLKAGANELEIEITNTWVNRLKADQALPVEQRQTFDQNNFAGDWGNPKKPFDPAGLIGPVVLRAYREVAVDPK